MPWTETCRSRISNRAGSHARQAATARLARRREVGRHRGSMVFDRPGISTTAVGENDRGVRRYPPPGKTGAVISHHRRKEVVQLS